MEERLLTPEEVLKIEEKVLTPEEVFNLRKLGPQEPFEVAVEGTPSKPRYLQIEKNGKQKKLGIIFNLEHLECGIPYKTLMGSVKLLTEITKSTGNDNKDYNKFIPMRVLEYLKTLEKNNITVKFIGKYNTASDIFEVDYEKTADNVEEARDNWHKKQIEKISQM